MEQWKKLALAEEKDPHLRKIIKEGPKGLSASWYYQAMHRKYGSGLKTDHSGGGSPPLPYIITSVQTKQMGLSKESIIECLRESYGESVTSAEIKAFCHDE